MIVYFADRNMKILGQASSFLPKGKKIYDDLLTEDVDTGVKCLEFYLTLTGKATQDARAELEEWTNAGNYILRQTNTESEFYTIIDSENDVLKGSVYVYAEDAGLDLINEMVNPYSADQAYSADYYISKFTYDSGFEIGLNEISNLQRKLRWEGEQTVTERILSVATRFDAEISFRFEIQGMSVAHKYIDLHKKRGKDLDVTLRIGKEIDSIIIKKSVKNLATALRVTGGTKENEEIPINLQGYVYDDGDFYVENDLLLSRNALAKWSRYLSESGNSGVGHIVSNYSYDTTSQSELCNRALSRLKKICDMEKNCEIELAKLSKDIQLGDVVNVVDFEGGLYLKARILKLENSETNDTRKATVEEYLENGD